MSNEEFRLLFELVSKEAFHFLTDTYSFKHIETKITGFGIYSQFFSDITGVELWYDIRDNYVNLVLFPLFNGKKIIESYKKQIYLEDLFANKERFNLSHKLSSSVPLKNAMKETFGQFAKALQENGQDVLKGDFSKVKPLQ